MSQDQFANIARLEVDLWDAADDLRTNSKLTAGEYSCGRAHAASISFTISAPSGGNLRAIPPRLRLPFKSKSARGAWYKRASFLFLADAQQKLDVSKNDCNHQN